MGEIAEMMLNGTLCSWCGTRLHGGAAGNGFPQLCPECAKDGEPVPQRSFRCKKCGKECKSEIGVSNHMRDKHKEPHNATRTD